jgi:Fe-S cluster assembly iron-binding protein IscA
MQITDSAKTFIKELMNQHDIKGIRLFMAGVG